MYKGSLKKLSAALLKVRGYGTVSQKVSGKLSQGQFCVYFWVKRRYTHTECLKTK